MRLSLSRNFSISFFKFYFNKGAIISPHINFLGVMVWGPLPYFVFSFNAFLAGFLVLILPDPINLGYL